MKRFSTFLAAGALSLVVAVQPAAAAASFPDVPKSNRFHDEVNYLVGKEIISGYSNGNFLPKKNVTRGEAAIMIGRMLGVDGAKRDTKFKDVTKNYGASGYIAATADKGIINGHPDGTFRPNESITRGDMAIILDRAFGLEFGSAQTYKDVGVKMKAETSISHITSEHIATGYANETFRPLDKVTREQFSAFLARGLSPVYRQRVVYKDGYSYNLLNQYVYTTKQGDVEVTYKQGMKGPIGVATYKGFAWEYKNIKTNEIHYEIQGETSRMLTTGEPYSSYYEELRYPLTQGKKWEASYSTGNSRQVTGVNKTVSTPYKQFTNAVEVTTQYGQKIYYVKGIGRVKLVNPDGKTVNELKTIR